MLSLLLLALAAPEARDDSVSYDRDIAPIFEAHCVECHGEEKQKAGLRLDSSRAALAGSDQGEFAVIVAAQVGDSLLYELVTATDEDERMPPKGAALGEQQLDLLRRWIDSGAEGSSVDAPMQVSEHWAYLAPTRPVAPDLESDWPRSDLDRFVLAGMQTQGLTPSPEADRATLLRRLSLDLTGLPPGLEELDCFLADDSPAAYEHAVERLLASPAYGERMARSWLDLARYADTNGFEQDGTRSMWRWRDWVIGAFNADMPFDQFTIEQLAGDMLDDATLEQRIATGFHRNTMVNAEGGVDPEEYRIAAVIDRVNTTGTVWMGTTLSCARCHSHKFDPISQREYFRLFAIFNSSADGGPSTQPIIEAPLPEQVRQAAQNAAEIALLEAELGRWTPEFEAELEALHLPAPEWLVLTPETLCTASDATLEVRPDGALLAGGPRPLVDSYTLRFAPAPGEWQQLRIEVLEDPALPLAGPGRADNGNFVLSEVRARLLEVESEPAGEGARELEFSHARADFFQSTNPPWPPEHAIDSDLATGWAIMGELEVPHQLVLQFAEPIEVLPGEQLEIEIVQEYGTNHVLGCLRIAVSGETPESGLPLRPDIEALVLAAKTPAKPTSAADIFSVEQEARLQRWFLQTHDSLDAVRERLADLRDKTEVPTALVMEELAKPRVTRIFDRGSFLSPLDEVQPGVPKVMGDLAQTSPHNRLALARWLVDGQHPLTARVQVNRVWAQLFGKGLVRTEGDFGTQGSAPSHPLLLDWLASEYVAGGWSTKTLIKTMVLSAVYRQSSTISGEALRIDPENLMLARGARFRVEAEMLRDAALESAGLLDHTLGGRSVFPPQPEGIWQVTYNSDRWNTATDENRFRRGLYTFWRRTAPYPAFMTFDAPSRELACTRRASSNTPLQALVLLNDPAFVEAAVHLAARMLREAGENAGACAARGFRLCTGRRAEADEIAALVQLYGVEAARFAKDPEAAQALIASATALDASALDPTALAAWAVVANVLLNLDETLTRG
ncbi:MAG: PSD1 and planctomycete cytochrome C domain-containing protein [bacterium]|jgi:mono/diheme cytochrome c family protein|nr:DUF1553 domain-containing protein [Planctomycetota bacterium]HIL52295.1 DUF1553 domain-containing protein [Planctomycetota bacterium]